MSHSFQLSFISGIASTTSFDVNFLMSLMIPEIVFSTTKSYHCFSYDSSKATSFSNLNNFSHFIQKHEGCWTTAGLVR